jgi:hypothetical protein
LTVLPDYELRAVVIEVPQTDFELLLAPHAVIDLLLRLVAAVDRLQRGRDL